MEHEAIPRFDMENNTEASDDGNVEPCYLLDKLPGELRNEIWKLALYYPKGIVVDCVARKLKTTKSLALTMTCKQIKAECGNLLFTQNDLRLEILRQHEPKGNYKEGYFLCDPIDWYASLAAKFRGVHVALGQRTNAQVVLPFMPIDEILKRCRKHELSLEWSFEMVMGDKQVDYNIPMQNEEGALAAVDRVGKHVQKYETSMLTEVHELIKYSVAECFDRSLIITTPYQGVDRLEMFIRHDKLVKERKK